MKLWQRNLLLVVLALGLVAIPLLFAQGAEWKGADDRSTAAIQELQADYQPWFESVFVPQGYERWMFGLQALLGSIVLSGGLGWLVGRHQGMVGGGENDMKVAGLVAVVAVVAAACLFLVQTEFGEIEAFISATQGLLVGMLAFFPGYRIGQRQGAARTGVSTSPPGTTAR